MDDQSPVNEPQPELMDRREARRQRRLERLADPSRGGAWAMGLILIILGGIFLLRLPGLFQVERIVHEPLLGVFALGDVAGIRVNHLLSG